MEQKKARLLRLLTEKSFRYSPEAPFKLASGRESPYYVDCRPVTHSAEGLTLIGEIIFDLIKDQGVQAVGGLTMGADPMAHAVALISYQQGQPINAFSVRKEAKGHGTGRLIEGPFRAGARVVVVEDVITTGGSAHRAIEAVQAAGGEVLGVLAVVDREEGGAEYLVGAGFPVRALVRLRDLTD